MCDTRDFHATLSRLAYARAQNTLSYIRDEAKRIDEQCKNHQWRKLNEQISPADRMLIAEMMSDPTAARCGNTPAGPGARTRPAKSSPATKRPGKPRDSRPNIGYHRRAWTPWASGKGLHKWRRQQRSSWSRRRRG